MKTQIFLLACLLAFTSSFAQTYQITFTGSGLSSSVTSVKVWNLTRDTSFTMGGSDTLFLVNTSNINEAAKDIRPLSIYPNPTEKQATIRFHNPLSGQVVLDIYDLAGKLMVSENALLPQGDHSFTIEGLNSGLYFVMIQAGGKKQSGKLVSVGESVQKPALVYSGKNNGDLYYGRMSGVLNQVHLAYEPDDLLMFKGISGTYSRIVTLVPTQSQSVNFEFVSCVDMNNQHYSVVTIGTQTWMAENLRTNKYKDGTSIPHVVDPAIWGIQFTPAYCWYDNDSATFSGNYGALYKWFTVETGNLCPNGWHVPTQAEWSDLISYLGNDSLTGGKLKATGLLHWDSPNTDAINETGFTALPGGSRAAGTGSFQGVGQFAIWWSATGYSTSSAYCYQIDHDSGELKAIGNNKGSGFAVRCIKD